MRTALAPVIEIICIIYKFYKKTSETTYLYEMKIMLIYRLEHEIFTRSETIYVIYFSQDPAELKFKT